jgi:hypothetical protein
MTSFANVSTSEMELTPCRISFKPQNATGFIDLGGTLDNVVVKMTYKKAEIKADQSGETIRDRRVSGVEVTVTTAITQTKKKELWSIVFPHADFITGGTQAIDFKQNIGDSDLARAGELKIHPLSVDDSDLSFDLTFYRATANADAELFFSPTEQQKLPVVFNILPDDSVTGRERFFRYGDPAL